MPEAYRLLHCGNDLRLKVSCPQMSILLFHCHRVQFCDESVREGPNLDLDAQNFGQARPRNIIFTQTKRETAAAICLTWPEVRSGGASWTTSSLSQEFVLTPTLLT